MGARAGGAGGQLKIKRNVFRQKNDSIRAKTLQDWVAALQLTLRSYAIRILQESMDRIIKIFGKRKIYFLNTCTLKELQNCILRIILA